MSLKKTVLAVAAAAAVLMLPALSQAQEYGVIEVDPYIGQSGSFGWTWYPEYPAQPEANSWRLTTGAQSQWILFEMQDRNYAGDNFENITLNGVRLPWDEYIRGVGDKFDMGPHVRHAEGRVKLLLAANSAYTIEFTATPCRQGCEYGGSGNYQFTPLAAVPEPQTYALMLTGVAALLARRKLQRAPRD
ncbi:PEP-CTERM sorting domain-containing protein [Aquabacterium sp. A7-Y]|uniref:PEP-CTERM sorting domain-containing protein n=1 Tax=Aquabacterium sp. A7-Y TaxID=1349605 RepID=UPI00223D9D83|nr:PEP-CTERM sorting domain-containing protein [Aquabacterium sp. A7-Y]MCW7537997.1 PEP-CTERM sorting domain-containing protein [Aquabacterium sp. A7-Y]